MAEPRTIGRFELVEQVASGSSGTVYQARDSVTGERVAVKILRGLGGVETARFTREARVLAGLCHPGVVRYVDHGEGDGGDPYIVMEWLDGEDLRERLARGGISMNESVALGLRVAEALAAVHAAGLVHRDVKPGNIFLPGRRAAEAKLLDFGLVRADSLGVTVTGTGLVVGTPAYMAPEQARGQRELDGRADVFSLGAVLFKCLAGRAPFEGTSVMAVLTKVVLEEPPRLRELRPDVPAALDDLVARMLQKDPERRVQSAARVAEALEALGPLGAAGERSDAPLPSSRVIEGLTSGEQRVMAMVFVGAAGGDTLPESGTRFIGLLDPPREEAIGALAEEHGGRLDRLADGTRVVTLAGSGVATDHATRAARFALALRAVLPDVPMALATGRAEVARGLPVGEAIERATLLLGRRADAARAGERASKRRGGAPGPRPPAVIAVDHVTAALLGPRFQVTDGEDGLALEGPRELALEARTLLGLATPMVGRAWELASVEALFFECVEEPQARALLVTAPAGMGKSRLGHEVVGALRRQLPDLEVWTGRADPRRAGSALGLLGEVVRSACSLQEGEPLEARRRRLVDRLAGHLQVAQFLGEIVDAPFGDDATVGLRAAREDPHLMSAQIRAAWEALLAAACAAGPVLVVLEDVHWADAATLRFFEAALGNLERHPWMVLALARPEVHQAFPRLWASRRAQEIRLKPLPRRACEQLVRHALGFAVSAETVARLVAKAEGNAFYLEELIRAVAEDARTNPRPETVLGMVQARLESLDVESRRTLRAASVFGEVFWPGGVEALLGSPPAPGWEDALVGRELVAWRPASRFTGEREIGFRHALVREGVYATLTEADRVLGHRLAGEWLEAHGESDAVVLAGHFDVAGDAERAAAFHLAAAWQALRGADPDAAITRAEQALARDAPPRGSGALRCECLSLLCEAHAWRDDWAHCADLALEVTRLAPPGSTPWIQAQAIRETGAFILGRPHEALAALFALAGAEHTPEAGGAVASSLAVGVLTLCLAGQFSVARVVLDRVEAAAAGTPVDDGGRAPIPPAPITRGWAALARCYWAAWSEGDFWAALGQARAARQRFAEADDLRHARFAQLFVAMCLWSLGLAAEAEAELRALPLTSGDDLVAAIRSLYLTLVLIERGSLAEAQRLAEQRLAQARARQRADDPRREAEARWLLGTIAARAGDLEAAERELSACLPLLALLPLQWQIAAPRLALVYLAKGRVDEGLALARAALQAQRDQGGFGQRGTLVQLACAEALAAAGEREAAAAGIAAARDALLARAARIEDEATRRAFLSEVPENARVLTLAEAWVG